MKNQSLCLCLGLTVAVAWALTLQKPASIAKEAAGSSNPYYEFNIWINSLIMPKAIISWAEAKFGSYYGFFMTCYIRDYMAALVVYYGTNSIWHFVIYTLKGKEYFDGEDALPTRATILDQIMLAQSSITLYAMLPVFSEWIIESGWTRVYYNISDIGGPVNYVVLLALYFSCVEIGIYWMHRTLHTNKFLYKYIHALHHKYNKANTLTPWSSIAFNPIDGLLQASPYVVCIFFIPCHYFTHVLLLFFTGIWATNIHDTLYGATEPIMGSKYHLVHHTHYMYNYGQVFIFCDRFWGTLRRPEDIKGYTCNGLDPRKGLAGKEK